jgi:hypothetical protein
MPEGLDEPTRSMGPMGSRRAGISTGLRDTRLVLSPTPDWENRMLKKAKNKAAEILLTSADLYREMTLSALRLVGRRA